MQDNYDQHIKQNKQNNIFLVTLRTRMVVMLLVLLIVGLNRSLKTVFDDCFSAVRFAWGPHHSTLQLTLSW